MYSNFIKIVLTSTAFSPILFSYWLVTVILNFNHFSIYLDLKTWDIFLLGCIQLFKNHYLLFVFIIILIISKSLISNAVKNLPITEIGIKSIKPSDVNFDRIIFSYLLPWMKFSSIKDLDYFFLAGFLFYYLIYVMLGKNSYHYNIAFKILLGYRNYEIQTNQEVTYLMLSNEKIINSKQAKRVVTITDYMLINVTKKDGKRRPN